MADDQDNTALDVLARYYRSIPKLLDTLGSALTPQRIIESLAGEIFTFDEGETRVLHYCYGYDEPHIWLGAPRRDMSFEMICSIHPERRQTERRRS